jgi:hypothetical protein
LGRNQHHLPQLLLRRFSSRRRKSQFFVWLFRKGEPPAEPNVRNVAASAYFYSQEGLGGAEDALSHLEDRYAELLREFDETGEVSPGREADCVDFSAHFLVRTRHLREASVEAIDWVARRAFNTAREKIPTLESDLIERVTKGLNDQGLSAPPDLISAYAKRTLSALPSLFKTLGGEDAIMARINMPKKAQTVQAKIIQAGFSGRKATLASLKWQLVQVTDGYLILGDVGALAQARDKPLLQPGMSFNVETHRRLIIPIASSTLLIGCVAEEPDSWEPGSVEINGASAELSRDFFVSSTRGEVEKRLHSRIGVRGSYFLDQAREELGEDESP